MAKTSIEMRASALRQNVEFYRRFAADYEKVQAVSVTYKARCRADEIEGQIEDLMGLVIPEAPKPQTTMIVADSSVWTFPPDHQ
ncbi:MAG: hypothetical protein ACRYGG_07760 [Janthinobacterium lividum]